MSSRISLCGLHRLIRNDTLRRSPVKYFVHALSAIAGIGVAILVVSFVLGVLGMYMYYRRQGGAFLPKKIVGGGDITQSD